ncbi:MAG: DUF2855 family protein [Chloroflexota bacterium]
MNKQFWINKAKLQETQFVEAELPAELAAGQVLCRVDEVAFTANNITYAVAGVFMKYWDFFPTSDEAWGQVPVWGFADVVASASDEIAIGERLYGYWPLASHAVLTAVSIKSSNFSDGAAHRQHLSPIYNSYVRTQNAPGFDQERLNSLLRPMFTTSFLLDDFLADNDFFGGKTIVLSSASSKTGYGTAFLLKRNRPERGDYEIVGLTSEGNVPFVESLGCYDRVLAYEEVQAGLDASVPAVYADFSGNGRLRHTIHLHYGDQLKYDSAIGLTDWVNRGSGKGLPGVEPVMFFAPAQAQKRQKEWGGSVFMRNVHLAMIAFMGFAAGQMEVVALEGETAVSDTYQAMLNNQAPPKKGYILSLK